jgi:hypothetical protein
MHDNPATMETDLSFGPAPAVADPASATIMRRAGELPFAFLAAFVAEDAVEARSS